MYDDRIRELVKKLPPEDAAIFLYHLQRHDGQVPPDPLPYMWFIRAGRGAGKTWCAANHVFEWTKNMPITQPKDRIIRVALVGATSADAKHTMVEGGSGMLSVIPPSQLMTWNRTSGELRYELLHPTRREVLCQTYSSEKPDQIRGPEHNIAWIDEVGKLGDGNEDPLKGGTTFSNLFMSLRLGKNPHMIITGTPVANKLVKFLDQHDQCVTTNMSTWDNRENLPPSQLERLEKLKPGTRFYDQEILGKILFETPDALFNLENIEENRRIAPPEMDLVLGYDPASGMSEDSDESGIILIGVNEENGQDHAYVIKDESGQFSPQEGPAKVIDLVLRHKIKTLCVELNQGLTFITTTLRQIVKDKTNDNFRWKDVTNKKAKDGPMLRYKVVTPDHIFFIHGVFSTQGKQLRAESAAIAYEMDLVHHTKTFEKLEEQMIYWSPSSKKDSPDRLDALVFCLLEVFGSRIKTKTYPTSILVPPATDLSSFGSSKNPYAYEGRAKKTLSVYNLDIR